MEHNLWARNGVTKNISLLDTSSRPVLEQNYSEMEILSE